MVTADLSSLNGPLAPATLVGAGAGGGGYPSKSDGELSRRNKQLAREMERRPNVMAALGFGDDDYYQRQVVNEGCRKQSRSRDRERRFQTSYNKPVSQRLGARARLSDAYYYGGGMDAGMDGFDDGDDYSAGWGRPFRQERSYGYYGYGGGSSWRRGGGRYRQSYNYGYRL